MPKTLHNKHLLTNELLYLRYGSIEPSAGTPALLTIRTIATLMKQNPTTLRYLEKLHFRPPSQNRLSLQPPKLNVRPSRKKGSAATPISITEEELEYITSRETLRAQASYPLTWRCVMFHRRFHDRFISPASYGAILK